MKDIFNSLFEVSKERIKSPFIGSFIFSWIAFNWKPIVYLFLSDDSIENRIQVISQFFESPWSGLIYPLLFALIYVVGLPYIMWGLEELYTKAKEERLANKLRLDLQIIKNNQITTRENIKLEDIKAEYKEVKELNLKIENLENELNEKDKTYSELRDKFNSTDFEKDQLQGQYDNLINLYLTNAEKAKYLVDYKIFRQSKILESFGVLASQIKLNGYATKNYINKDIEKKLEFEGLIQVGSNDEAKGKVIHTLTKKGEYFWDLYLNELFREKQGYN